MLRMLLVRWRSKNWRGVEETNYTVLGRNQAVKMLLAKAGERG